MSTLTVLLVALSVLGNEPQTAPTVSKLKVVVGVNTNDGSESHPLFAEYIFRDATGGRWPVPTISDNDLAHNAKPVMLLGRASDQSGPIEKLTDGAASEDNQQLMECFFLADGLPAGQFRISLPRSEPISQINIYSAHGKNSNSNLRAPQRIHIYASDGAADETQIDDARSSSYRLIAEIDTSQIRGEDVVHFGQHGASVHGANGESLGTYQHFIFEVYPNNEKTHTCFSEIDIVRAETPPKELPAHEDKRVPYFDEVIAPLLANRCLGCHNESEKKGGLNLSQEAGLTAGGDSGEPMVASDPQSSYLIQRVMSGEMPPEHPLPEREKQILRDWVTSGAEWGTARIDPFRYSSDSRAGYDWWSLQPVQHPPIPATKNSGWAINNIDRFVLARLEAKGLSPSPRADRRTLIRRATFDLLGLPPTPEAVETFVNDNRPDAYERLINDLLASPHYGERWARHWLDVVRYAESQGFERNKYYPSAWKYRDWVIQAFNDDMPYDDFVRRQIAGDILYPNDAGAIIATGYLACTPHDLLGLMQGSPSMKAVTREDELENLVGNVGQEFLGLTVHCARCHDHKFDPISQTEYFQLASALGGVKRTERSVPAQLPHAREAELSEFFAIVGDGAAEQVKEARVNALGLAEQAMKDAQAAYEKQKMQPVDENTPAVIADRHREVLAAEDELQAIKASLSTGGLDTVIEQATGKAREAWAEVLTQLSTAEMRQRLASGGIVHAVKSESPQYFYLLARGSIREPLSVITPRGIRCVQGVSKDWGLAPNAPESQRRLQLANWITDSKNPLFARTIANRLWHYHFDVGLVDTPNDLGFNGGRPSHPELLDWLADELVRGQWSLKHLHREIMLSATYQQLSQANREASSVDVDNRLLWRKSPRRLEAEAVRDAILQISGRLNPRLGGPSFSDLKRVSGDNFVYEVVDEENELSRRTIYRTIARARTSPLLETLDCADPSVSTPKRNVTTTPLQALSLLNNPLVDRSAKSFAERLRRESGEDIAQQIERGYQLAFSRDPTAEQLQEAQQFIDQYSLEDFCLVLFNSNEFLYIE